MTFLASDRDLSRNSYYAATATRSQLHAPLSGAIRCDVAIVGAGLAGLSAAIELRERGLDVVVLEAREVGWGASGRNGGQAIHGLACGQEVVEAQLGLADARRVWDMSIEALDILRERIPPPATTHPTPPRASTRPLAPPPLRPSTTTR